MRERLIIGEPPIVVYANDLGEIVLQEVSAQPDHSVRIPYEKIHQVTVWMRRIAAEFDGVRISQ